MDNQKKIGEIKSEYDAAAHADNAAESGQDFETFIDKYIADGRPGVAKLVGQAQRKMEALRKERERMEGLKFFEHKYEDEYEVICGIDEAGRGPLAGPVVAAAVVFPKDTDILYVNDSKKLSAAKRDELFDTIYEKAVAVGIGQASCERIDEINILQATYEAMRAAISELSVVPDLLLNDAVTIPDLPIDAKQIAIVKGDAKSVSIGAASIIAKVTRDRIMLELDAEFPEYGFAKHKGYGTAEHIAALKEFGASPIHRKSFIGHFV